MSPLPWPSAGETQRREPLLARFGARRGQQEQVGALELTADLAVVGTELVGDGVVERFDRFGVRHTFGHAWSTYADRLSIPSQIDAVFGRSTGRVNRAGRVNVTIVKRPLLYT